jgi:DNA-directed RNA polymerase subunit RPC12/RpoP
VSDPPKEHEGEVLRATLTVTGWRPGSEEDVADTIERVTGARVALEVAELPIVVLDRALPDDARQAEGRLTAAGAETTLDETWVPRGESHAPRATIACPSCGSAHTQPFSHAGPAARVNRKCTDCGHLFKNRTTP